MSVQLEIKVMKNTSLMVKMLVLFETAAGYAMFKLQNEKKLKNVDNIFDEFSTAEKAQEK
ncbi:NOP5NT domain protein [Ancylostoma caninum]|uniref:NOP5NT domain protein n=1 Tax=Ancylostoma caninum TaxID=29170 RepID=A0A368FSC4_ANCCA|nr:NOP5NT domain protein [Ancylostoma caninum]